MSAFGGRVPPIIQQPYAQPDASNVGLDFGQGLAQALGVVSNVIQSRGQAAAQEAENAQMAQRLNVGATEIEQAKTQLDIAKQRRANLDVHLQTEQEKAKGDQLANLELFGVRSALAGMPEDQQAQWLAEHPVHDAKNASAVARGLGDSLATSKMTEVFQAIAENPETNVTELVTSKMAGIPFAQLHPDAALEFRDSLLTRAVGYKTQQINNIVQAREAEGRQKATEKAQTRTLMNITDGVALDPSDPMSLWRAVEDEQRLNRRDTTATAVGDAAADHIAYAVNHTMRVAGGDPAKIAPIQSWLKQATAGDDQLHRTAREKLKALGVYEAVDSELKDAVSRQTNAQITGLRRGIDDASSGLNMVQMNLFKPEAERLGQMDYWNAKSSTISALDMELKAAKSFIRGEGEKPSDLSTEAVNQLYKSEGIDTVLRNFGTVPTDFVRDIKENISAGNTPEAFAEFRAIDQYDPSEADRIAKAIGDDGMPIRIAAQLTRGMDANTPTFQRYFNALIADPNSVTYAQLAVGRFKPPKDGEEAAVPLVPSAAKALGRDDVGSNATGAFKDFYSFRFIEAMQKSGGDPAAAENPALLDSVLKSAQNDLARSYTTVGGVAVPHDIFGVGSNASPMPGASTELESEITRFRTRAEGGPGAARTGLVADFVYGASGKVIRDTIPGIGAKVMVEKAVNIAGKAYVPAVAEDENGVVKPVRYLEWDIATQKAKEIDATKPGTANKEIVSILDGVFSGKIDRRELDAIAPIMWRDDYGTRSLKEYDATTSGRFSAKVKGVAVDRYLKLYGPLPSDSMRNSDSPGERKAYTDSRDRLYKLTQFIAERAGWSTD